MMNLLKERLETFHAIVLKRQIPQTIRQKLVYLFNIIERHFFPIIYVIGDSHSFSYAGIKFFINYTIGRATAFNLCNEKSSTRSKERLFKYVQSLGKRSIILMVLGEIDCRIHIYNQYRLQAGRVSIRDLIQKTVENYCAALVELKKINKKVVVLSIPPAGYQKNIFNIPYYGTSQIRAQIHKDFNELLQRECQKKMIKFVTIYKYVVTEKGLLRKEYAADDIHLKPSVVTFFLRELKQSKEV